MHLVKSNITTFMCKLLFWFLKMYYDVTLASISCQAQVINIYFNFKYMDIKHDIDTNTFYFLIKYECCFCFTAMCYRGIKYNAEKKNTLQGGNLKKKLQGITQNSPTLQGVKAY
jgi:hypothetical protein